MEVKGERDEADPLWIAVVILMILRAIYAGKLAVQAGQCCVRRLHVWLSSSSPEDEMRTSSTSSTTMEWNDDVGESSASPLNMWQQSGSSASSNSLRLRSGLEQSTSSAGPMQSTLDNSKRQAHSKAVHSKGPSAAGGSYGGAGTSAAGSRG